MRAIIIGSGIAGLATGLALRQIGMSFTLYERASALREVGAGISLWANALRALDALNAGDAVRAKGQPGVVSEFRVNEGRTVAARFLAKTFEDRNSYAPFILMIHRADLVGALASLQPEADTRYGYECTAVEQKGEQVRVTFHNGHSDTADLVIGADGLHSAVRRAILGPQEPRYAGYTCWRGICPRPASVEPGYLAEWWGCGLRFGITTIPGDRCYWFSAMNAPANNHNANEKEAVAQAFRGWAAPAEEMIANTPAVGVLRNDICDRVPKADWAQGRCLLIGDAAHPTTPNFGQGGSMAIEDAVVLARHLKAKVPVEERLQAFVKERYARTSAITKDSWRFGNVGQWENRLACGLRNRLMGVILPLIGERSLPKYAAFNVGTI